MERVSARFRDLSVVIVKDSLGQTKEYLAIGSENLRVPFEELIALLDAHLIAERESCRLG